MCSHGGKPDVLYTNKKWSHYLPWKIAMCLARKSRRNITKSFKVAKFLSDLLFLTKSQPYLQLLAVATSQLAISSAYDNTKDCVPQTSSHNHSPLNGQGSRANKNWKNTEVWNKINKLYFHSYLKFDNYFSLEQSWGFYKVFGDYISYFKRIRLFLVRYF